LKLPAILGDFLAIALEVTAIAPISIIRKQAACSQAHHQQNSCDRSFHSHTLLRVWLRQLIYGFKPGSQLEVASRILRGCEGGS
jgi:hypothetical protein